MVASRLFAPQKDLFKAYTMVSSSLQGLHDGVLRFNVESSIEILHMVKVETNMDRKD